MSGLIFLLGAEINALMKRMDLHEERSRRTRHEYTIEKNGARKLIYQAPWFEAGEYRDFVEIALPLPDPLPHFVREILALIPINPVPRTPADTAFILGVGKAEQRVIFLLDLRTVLAAAAAVADTSPRS